MLFFTGQRLTYILGARKMMYDIDIVVLVHRIGDIVFSVFLVLLSPQLILVAHLLLSVKYCIDIQAPRNLDGRLGNIVRPNIFSLEYAEHHIAIDETCT